MPIKPRLPTALRDELGVGREKRRGKKVDRGNAEPRKKRKLYQPQSDEEATTQLPKSKSILKKAKTVAPPKTREDVLMDQDDAEIDYWEAKLGSKKGASADELDDGLDDIFDGLSLPRGQSRLEEIEGTDDESGSEGDMQDFLDAEGSETASDDHEVPELIQDSGISRKDDDDFTQFDDEKTESENQKPKPSIYLPYATEVGEEAVQAPKTSTYVPPALRKKQANAEMTQLKRQLKGLLNRLSISNIGTIVAELEAMYRSNPRGSMNEELSSLLLEVVSDKSNLLDTFVILHAALIAALYKTAGMEFAASFVQTTVETVLAVSSSDLITDRKSINLMTLLAELYNFNVIAATLPYDFIRLLVADLNELNVEILLVVVRNCGTQLRSDDPSALKDILTLLQEQIKSQYAEQSKELPLRMKFMVDAMMNLKNNKSINSEGQQAKESRTRLKKYIGGLNTKTGQSGGEPIRVGLDDIRNVESRGKWWLVGASWKNNQQSNTDRTVEAKSSSRGTNTDQADVTKHEELLLLARQHRLNNPIRKQIFITILSASDYSEAITALLSLRLKKSQEAEIARVLVLLVGSEETYNPYYAVLARHLSDRHGMRISLQFCLWDFLRDCGEDEVGQIGSAIETDGREGQQVDLRRGINVAKFFGTLVGHGVLPITVLKTLTFARLKSLTKRVLDLLLSEAFLTVAKLARGADREREKQIVAIFSRVKTFDRENHNASLRDGLDWFLRKVVVKAAVVSGPDEAVVKEGVEIARMVLSL